MKSISNDLNKSPFWASLSAACEARKGAHWAEIKHFAWRDPPGQDPGAGAPGAAWIPPAGFSVSAIRSRSFAGREGPLPLGAAQAQSAGPWLVRFAPAHIEAEAPFMVMVSVGGGGGYIGELIIPFSHIVAPVVGVIIGAWLQSRSGRKVRVKIGDNEIEATTKEALTTEEQLDGRDGACQRTDQSCRVRSVGTRYVTWAQRYG